MNANNQCETHNNSFLDIEKVEHLISQFVAASIEAEANLAEVAQAAKSLFMAAQGEIQSGLVQLVNERLAEDGLLDDSEQVETS